MTTSTASSGRPPRSGKDHQCPPRHGEGDHAKRGGGAPDRLSAAFARAKAQSRAALVTFVTGGDPDLGQTPEIVRACVAGGADIVEIGMPFSDPMADGPAIQNASLRALGAGTTVAGILDAVRAVRTTDPTTPLILMGYLNPLLAYGTERFAGDAHAAGVDGCIVVDAPPEEDAAIGPQLRAHGLHLIRLATPTTDAARLPAVLSGASGFLYYVAVAGITGTASADPETIRAALAPIRAASDIPLAVGFGVRTPAQARAIAGAGADAVVVGSALVEIIGHAAQTRANDIPARVETFVRALREGLSAPKSSA